GIPQADLAQMGKAFFRASNAHKARVSGTGLGLHITRSLCELQGGTLWFESQEGQGTTAFVTIPIDDGIFAG
ncbi:MAG: PAS domain-containing sensor histidine kinase, partial [Caldilineaceae bacterium]|nr:PAS domain-containing sensor histidine kinase [Caldilineaceae bacterium]